MTEPTEEPAVVETLVAETVPATEPDTNGALAETVPEPAEAVTVAEAVAPAEAPQAAQAVDGKRKLDAEDAADTADQPDVKRVTMDENAPVEAATQPAAEDLHQVNGSQPEAAKMTVDIYAGDLPADAPDGAGQMTGFVSCPEQLVSKLIGKKGAVIQNLEATTGAKIQVEHQKPGDPKQVRIVAKNQEELDSTKKIIKDTLESDHPLGEVTKVISCPHSMVGRIIGKAGQTILSLQQASQAKIIVDQDAERFPAGADREIRVIGMPQSVDRAEKMVTELMHADPGVSSQSVIQKLAMPLQYGLGSTRTMNCPKSMVGRVIGKQGDTIKQLQRNTGANIQIDQSSDPCTITLTGQVSSINNAMRDINTIINDNGMGGMGGGGGGMYGGGGGGGMGYGYPGYGMQQGGGYGYGMGGGYGQPPGGYGMAGGYGGGYGGYQQPQQPAYGGYGGDPYAAGGYGGGYQQPHMAQAGGYGGAAAGGGGGGQWNEEWDQASGRHYYYNTVTGMSQWEKPAEMM